MWTLKHLQYSPWSKAHLGGHHGHWVPDINIADLSRQWHQYHMFHAYTRATSAAIKLCDDFLELNFYIFMIRRDFSIN